MKRIILSTILSIVFSFTAFAQENSESEEVNDWFDFVAEGIECMYANDELIRLIETHKALNGIFRTESSDAVVMVEERLSKNIELFEAVVLGALGYLENELEIPEDLLLSKVTEFRNNTMQKIYQRRDISDAEAIQEIVTETFTYVRWCRKWARDGLGEASPN